jgi:hypothetical protein
MFILVYVYQLKYVRQCWPNTEWLHENKSKHESTRIFLCYNNYSKFTYIGK